MGKSRTKRQLVSADSIEGAIALHRQGRLAEAERIYAAILADDPHHFNALHLSGLLKYQQGQAAEALRLMAAALRAKPGSAEALMDYGVILESLARHDEALAAFDTLLASRTDDAAVHYNRGNTLKALGRHEEALACYERALALAPDLAVAHHNRGSTYAQLGRDNAALASYDRVIVLALRQAGLAAAQGVASLLSGRGAVPFEAIDKALAADPANVDVLNNRGRILNRLKRHGEAVASFDRSLALRPAQADALCARGDASVEIGRFEEAFTDYAEALRIAPGHVDAHLKRGNALVALNRLDEALQCYNAALAIIPDNADAKFNAALVRLCMGDFRGGWPQYECRWDRAEFAKERPTYPRPLWRGESLNGKTILLVGEQGLGDAIQFARYAPMVAALGARVLLGVRPPLVTLMASVPGVAQVFGGGEMLPEFDLYCPLLSLPLAFGTAPTTIPARVPYIRAQDDRIAKWRPRLSQRGALRVGICWAGTGAHPNDRRRSIALAHFAAILSVPGIDFVSLQRDVAEADAAILNELGVVPLGQEFADFADTAAVAAMCDLVISVDTSVAHLAGAMAKAVAVLIPFSPDWRWMLDRTDSPWYPTMRLFRQTAIGDWGAPLARLRQELAGVVASRAARSAAAG